MYPVNITVSLTVTSVCYTFTLYSTVVDNTIYARQWSPVLHFITPVLTPFSVYFLTGDKITSNELLALVVTLVLPFMS